MYFLYLDVDGFDELTKAIASQKYFAGVMTSDLVRFYQDELFEQNLRIVQHYEAKVPMDQMILNSGESVYMDEIKACFNVDGMKSWIEDETFEKYQTYIKVNFVLFLLSLYAW